VQCINIAYRAMNVFVKGVGATVGVWYESHVYERAEMKWGKDNGSIGRVYTRLKGKGSEGTQRKLNRGWKGCSDPREGIGSVLWDGGEESLSTPDLYETQKWRSGSQPKTTMGANNRHRRTRNRAPLLEHWPRVSMSEVFDQTPYPVHHLRTLVRKIADHLE